jgi:hypothetical protein
MVLASLPLPKKYQGMAFASMPDQHEPADTNSMSELEGDDDL